MESHGLENEQVVCFNTWFIFVKFIAILHWRIWVFSGVQEYPLGHRWNGGNCFDAGVLLRVLESEFVRPIINTLDDAGPIWTYQPHMNH